MSNNITFQQYVKNVLGAQPTRSEDLRELIRVFGLPALDDIASGKRIVDVREFVEKRGKNG